METDQSVPDLVHADANKILEIIRNWNGARGAHSHRGAVFYVLSAFGYLIPLSLKSALERLKSTLFAMFDYLFRLIVTYGQNRRFCLCLCLCQYKAQKNRLTIKPDGLLNYVFKD